MPKGQRRAAAGGESNRAGRPARTGRRGRRRTAGTGGSDNRIADLVARTINDLVAAVTQEVRRSVAAEVQGLLTGREAPGLRTRRVQVRKRVVQCLAPGCNNPSKGPRFHYLCEKHKDAKKQDYEAWRKQRKEKQAA